MVKAIPIDSKGNPIGIAKNFSDMQWDKMAKTFGKHIAWKKTEEIVKEEIKEVELIAVSTKKAKSKKNNEK